MAKRRTIRTRVDTYNTNPILRSYKYSYVDPYTKGRFQIELPNPVRTRVLQAKNLSKKINRFLINPMYNPSNLPVRDVTRLKVCHNRVIRREVLLAQGSGGSNVRRTKLNNRTRYVRC